MRKEKKLNNSVVPVSISGTKIILDQLIDCICKIKINDEFGTGFFCKIPFSNNTLLKVLMTNNHVIPKEELIIGNKIKLSYKNSLKYIEITGNRFFKTSVLLDYTCIEILDEDQIEFFYEIEPCFYEKSDYINDEIAIVQYPKGGILKVKVVIY